MGGFFLNRKDFFSLIAFLSELSWRNSFALKRCGEGWRMKDEGWGMRDEGWRMRGEGCGVRSAGCEYSITKFTEMWWNDSVFEGSEEHRRCSGKVTDFRLAAVEKLFPLWRDSSLCYASFRMTGLCFLLTIRNLYHWGNCFWNAKIFIIELLFLSKQSGNSLVNCWNLSFK